MAAFDALYLRTTIQMTPGRDLLVARRIRALLEPDEAPFLLAFVERAEASARRALSMNATRKEAKKGLYAGPAKEKDQALDVANGAVFGLLASYAQGFPEGSAPRGRAERLLAAFYPRSLEGATKQGYADELGEVDRVIGLAKGERAADVAATPGLPELLELLAARAAELEAVVPRGDLDGPSFAEAKAATMEAERRMAELVSAVIAHHHGDAPRAAGRRAALLAVYEAQQESMRERFRRRQAVGEIDPETGDPLEGDGVAAAVSAGSALEPVE